MSTGGSGISGEHDEMMFHMEDEIVDGVSGVQLGIKGESSNNSHP